MNPHLYHGAPTGINDFSKLIKTTNPSASIPDTSSIISNMQLSQLQLQNLQNSLLNMASPNVLISNPFIYNPFHSYPIPQTLLPTDLVNPNLHVRYSPFASQLPLETPYPSFSSLPSETNSSTQSLSLPKKSYTDIPNSLESGISSLSSTTTELQCDEILCPSLEESKKSPGVESRKRGRPMMNDVGPEDVIRRRKYARRYREMKRDREAELEKALKEFLVNRNNGRTVDPKAYMKAKSLVKI